MYTDIYIALGTNLGDRLNNFNKSISLLNNNNIVVKNKSKIYETTPMYETEQPRFLNMVIQAQTPLKAQDLLQNLKFIETEIGRTKTYTNGPRVVDLDILYYAVLFKYISIYQLTCKVIGIMTTTTANISTEKKLKRKSTNTSKYTKKLVC